MEETDAQSAATAVAGELDHLHPHRPAIIENRCFRRPGGWVISTRRVVTILARGRRRWPACLFFCSTTHTSQGPASALRFNYY